MGYIQDIPISYIIFLVLGSIAFSLIIIEHYRKNTIKGKLINTTCQIVNIPKNNHSQGSTNHVSMGFYNDCNKRIYFRVIKFKSTINKATPDKEDKKEEIHIILPKQTHTLLGPAVEHNIKDGKNWAEIEWECCYGDSEKNMNYSLIITREIDISKNNNFSVIDSRIIKYID